MGAAGAVPGQTGGLKAGSIFGKLALGMDGIAVSQRAVFHGRHQGGHLVSRTGRISGVDGTVDEGLVGGFRDLIVVLTEGLQIVGGIGSHGQDITGLDLHDHSGHTFDACTVAAGSDQLIDQVLNGIFRHHLDVNIQGGFQIIARLGFFAFQILLRNDGTVLSNLIDTGAIHAMEVFLEGLLQAGLTDDGVHVISAVQVLVVLPVSGVHGAGETQNVGGVLGVVFPDGGGFHVQTGNIQLQNFRQILVGDILNEDIVGKAGHAAQVELIEQTDDSTGFVRGPFHRDLIAFPQDFHQQGSGHIGVQRQVRQIALEIALPGGAVVFQGVFEGTGLGDGEVVGILQIQLLAPLQQIIQVLVTAVGGLDDIVVEHQVIAGAVAHQLIAVTVHHFATGSLHGDIRGIGGGVIGITADDLQTKELDAVQGQHQAEHTQQDTGTHTAYSFHNSPPICPIPLAM